jgi:dTDP-4-dehydrorhamnose reductase
MKIWLLGKNSQVDWELQRLLNMLGGLRTASQSSTNHGVFHPATAGERSSVEEVEPMATAAYPIPARRPLEFSSGYSETARLFSLHLPDWQSGVTRMLTEALTR